MENDTNNCNGKIQVSWSNEIQYNILDEDEQQITCEMKHNELQDQFITTFVYTKCKEHLRRPHWDKMLHQATVDNNLGALWVTTIL